MTPLRSFFGSKVQLCCHVWGQWHSSYSSFAGCLWRRGWRRYRTVIPRRPFSCGNAGLSNSQELAPGTDCGANEQEACRNVTTTLSDVLADNASPHTPHTLTQGLPTTGAKALPRVLCMPPAPSTTVGKNVPYFISGLRSHALQAFAGNFPRVTGQREIYDIAAAAPTTLPWQPTNISFDLESDAEGLTGGPARINGNTDLQRLQDRYDLLLRNPQAFGTQVQLLHARIQHAQQLQGKQLHMRQLQPLQDRLRTAGTGACLLVKPVVYAAFCVYSPYHIWVAAAMRVGAGAHLLQEYLKRKGLTKQKHGVSSIRFPRGPAGAEKWLANSSLQNVCVYPLEALSPQLRLFRSSAPLRLAAWEEILGKAVSW